MIGVGYGLLFVRQSNDLAPVLGWGTSYGVLWWLLGSLTLLPLLSGRSPQWTVEGATFAYPALIRHLAYGAFLGVVFFRLEARQNPWCIHATRPRLSGPSLAALQRCPRELLTLAELLGHPQDTS